MPLLDHFRPPLNRTHPWRSFHGAWAAAIARLLNGGVLPNGYHAMPFLGHDGPVEIDVATVQEYRPEEPASPFIWAPPAPELAVAVAWPGVDDIRVEIFADDGDPPLVAAIELVSPGNKDRPQTRDAFTAKCADYLRRGCGLVVVDVVTTRRVDFHANLLSLLETDPGESPYTAGALSAVAYRSVGRNDEGRLFAWPHNLEVGQPLPTVPLWLGGEVAVPLDLELSHTAACADLRIRDAG